MAFRKEGGWREPNEGNFDHPSGVRPPVWRRFQVPEGLTLFELHEVIEEVIGWYGGHLHQFIRDEKRYGIPEDFDDAWVPTIDEATVTLRDLKPSPKAKLEYDDDFGDGWDHVLTVEKIFVPQGKSLPVCLKGARSCPPEDCGAPWRYQELLKILKDTQHEEYEQWKTWFPENFDPQEFDLEGINEALSEKRWTL